MLKHLYLAFCLILSFFLVNPITTLCSELNEYNLVLYYLKFLDENKAAGEAHYSGIKGLLNSYNFLRNQEGLPLAGSEKDIDPIWLVSLGQKLWENDASKKAILSWGDTVEGMLVLLNYIQGGLHNPASFFYAFNAYNFLRQKIGKPPAFSMVDIKPVYLDALAKSFKNIVHSSKIKARGYDQPTESQQKQIEEEAIKVFGPDLGKKVVAASIDQAEYMHQAYATTESYLGQTVPLVALCKTFDYYQRLATLYHELGHVAQHAKILDPASLETDAQRFEEYVKVGVSALDSSTDIGKWINFLLQQNGGFIYKYVILPLRSGEKALIDLWSKIFGDNALSYINKQLVSRKNEMQADIFAMDKLYEQNRLEPLLAGLVAFATADELFVDYSNFVALQAHILGRAWQDFSKELSTHPTDLERALAIAGFLKSKGLDVNAMLKKWENEGTCLPAEKELASLGKKRFAPANTSKSYVMPKIAAAREAVKDAEKLLID